MDFRKFEVLECDGYTGLTVGEHVRRPGFIFTEKDWNFSSESLKYALQTKRCKELTEKKEEKKSDSKTKSASGGKE